MYQTPEITVTPAVISDKQSAPKLDVAELQTQLIKLQNQVTQLQAAQKTQVISAPTPTPTPVSKKPEQPMNQFKRSGTIIAPKTDVILLPREH